MVRNIDSTNNGNKSHKQQIIPEPQASGGVTIPYLIGHHTCMGPYMGDRCATLHKEVACTTPTSIVANEEVAQEFEDAKRKFGFFLQKPWDVSYGMTSVDIWRENTKDRYSTSCKKYCSRRRNFRWR